MIAIASVLTAVVTTGCGRLFPEGSGGSSGISVVITSVKFGSIVAGSGPHTLNAQIVGDSTNAGVIWTLTANGAPCSNDCGFLSGITPTTANYTPPSVVPGTPANAPKVTATAVADATRSDSDSFTINPGNITVTITNKVNAVVASIVAQPIPFAANTLNDSTNKGVSWSLSTTGGVTCTPAVCGTITGQTLLTATYQPPTSAQGLPAVTITATSAASGASASDSDTFAVLGAGAAPSSCNSSSVPTGRESLLKGSYAFFVQGTSVMAASFAADGAGNIQGGEIDSNDGTNVQHLAVIPTTTNASSFYGVGTDTTVAGPVGCLSLYTSNGATMIFRFALGQVNSAGVATRGRITEFDDQFDPSSNLGTHASGPLRLQDPSVFASGNTSDLQHNYAFGVGGSGGSSDPHAVVVGAFVLNPATGVIANSDFDSDDLSAALVQSDKQGSTGSIGSVSSKTGRAIFTFMPQSGLFWPGLQQTPAQTQAALYVVDSSEMFLVSIDPASSVASGSTPFLYAGRAIATGNAFSPASLSGNFILHETGTLAAGVCNQCADVSLGLLTFSGNNSSVSGKIFEYNAKNVPTTTALMGSATYNVSSTFGRVTLTGSGLAHPPVFYIAQPTGSTGPTYAFVGGTDPTAFAASGLLEPGAGISTPVTTADLEGKSYFFGDVDDPDDPTIDNRVGVLKISSTGGIAGTQFTSGPTALNLLSSGPVSITGVSIDNVNGPGTGNVGTKTVAITDGLKLFFIDETSGAPASITVVEPQ